MTVATVSTSSTSVAGDPVGPADGTPAPGFAAALAAASDVVEDPRRLPSVSLDEMLAALAQASPAPSTPPIATDVSGRAGGASAVVDGPSDAWGAAATGPVHVDGPGAAVLAAGERYLGVPYLWGGTDPDKGFDCSGFVQQVYADLGIQLPRVSIDQSKAGRPVDDMSAARPGDLVFWHGNGSRPNHIAIYAGEGRMLVAPRTGDVVRYQEITRTPDAIRRVIPHA